jgi:RHS repeat-associated protein
LKAFHIKKSQNIFSPPSNSPNRVGIRNSTDYSPFGVELDGRTVSDGYRYGFNGKEKIDEVSGEGNEYDFGARMYDARVGRFLSIDPLNKKFHGVSNYSYALNSPILFIDFKGEDPKVAILFYDSNEAAFNTHIKSLINEGYTIIKVSSGEELLRILGEYSCPESPIEQLILISHGSPGGPEMTFGGGGFWTESELINRSKSLWIEEKTNEMAKVQGLELDDSNENFNPELSYKLKVNVQVMASVIWNDSSPESEQIKIQTSKKYKAEKNIATICDFVDAIETNNIHFSNNANVVFAGCNIAGTLPLDDQEIFTTSFATETGLITYGSQGQTGPILNTSKRVSNSDSGIKDLKGHFIKTTADGKREIKSNILDMANP